MEIVKQDGNMDCGVSCLLSVIRHYGGNVPIEYLREKLLKENIDFSENRLYVDGIDVLHMTKFDDLQKLVKSENHRILTTGGHYAHLKIAEGCDKHCTYCIIPSIRGHYRSVPMEQLVQEAERLAAKGVRELIIIAQDTTYYGLDLYRRRALAELLQKRRGEGQDCKRKGECYRECKHSYHRLPEFTLCRFDEN